MKVGRRRRLDIKTLLTEVTLGLMDSLCDCRGRSDVSLSPGGGESPALTGC